MVHILCRRDRRSHKEDSDVSPPSVEESSVSSPSVLSATLGGSPASKSVLIGVAWLLSVDDSEVSRSSLR